MKQTARFSHNVKSDVTNKNVLKIQQKQVEAKEYSDKNLATIRNKLVSFTQNLNKQTPVISISASTAQLHIKGAEHTSSF